MAGYSGTPLFRKLGIKSGHRVALIDAPAGMGKLLKPLPDGVDVVTNLRSRRPYDVILCFCDSAGKLAR